MERAEAILRDPKTLIFFLAAFEHQAHQGTIMIVVQSALHVLYIVFLRRHIIKTIRNEQGIFSFQFGPSQKPSPVASPVALQVASLPTMTPITAFSRLAPNHGSVVSGHPLESKRIGEGGAERYLQAAKRARAEVLTGEPAALRPSKSAPLSKESAMPDKAVLAKQTLLESQVRALELTLFTSTKSLLAGSEATRAALEAKYHGQLQVLTEENASLRRAIAVLQKQNQLILAKVDGRGGEPLIHLSTSATSSPVVQQRPASMDVVLGSERPSKASPPPQLDSRWRCRWVKCQEAPYPNRDLLWRHVVGKHVRAQYNPSNGSVDIETEDIP